MKLRRHGVFLAIAALSMTACNRGRSGTGGLDVARSTLALQSNTPFADGVDTAKLMVRVLDSAGRALPGCVVELRPLAAGALIDQPGATDSKGDATAGIRTAAPGTHRFLVVVDPGADEVVLDEDYEIRFLEPPSLQLSTVSLSRSTAPANGETEVVLTATLRDEDGDPLDGQSVRFDLDDPFAVVVQPTGLTDGSGVATASVRTTRAAALRVLLTANPAGRPRLLHSQPSVTFLADPLVPDDSESIHGQNGASTPFLRVLSKVSGTWTAATALTGIATTLRHVVTSFSPTSNHERLSMVLAEDGAQTKLTLLRQIGEGWAESFSTTAVPLAHADKRCFDVEFEDVSGDALAIGPTSSTSGGSPLWYRSKVAGTWSPETPLPINDGAGPGPELGSGVPLWVELERRPDSNEIALAWVDAAGTLSVLVWDGSLWKPSSAKILTSAATKNAVSGFPHNRGFDLAWESVSSGLVAAWGEASVTGFVASRLDPSSQIWSAATTVAVQNGAAEHIDLAADPVSDKIGIVICDLAGTERLGVSMWNGTAWVQSAEIDSQIRDVNHGARGDWPAEVAWLGTSGVAICVYPDNLSARIDWCRYTEAGGWAAQTAVGVSGKGFTESVVLRSFLTQSHVLACFVDSFGKLWAAKYDGSTWTVSNGSAPIETAISTLDGRAFDIGVKLR